MESIMDVAATSAQGAANAARASRVPRARRPYEAPELQAVGLGAVFADGEYVYSPDAADNDFSGSGLFG